MPHRQLDAPYQGARYEYAVTFALSAVASVVPVPRPEDYGFDHLCTLTELVDGMRYPLHSFGLQVKPKSDAILKFGGYTDKGVWKKWEIGWLFNRDIPLILAVVDPGEWEIELYSTWNVWHPYWMVRMPFEVWLRPEQVPEDEKEPKVPRYHPAEGLKPEDGDAQRVSVFLGPPILKVGVSPISEHEDLMRKCLKAWIEIDALNLWFRKLGVPWMYSISSWETNRVPALGSENWMFWQRGIPLDSGPDQAKELLRTLAPIVFALAKIYEERSAPNQLRRLSSIAAILDDEGLIPDEMKHLFATG